MSNEADYYDQYVDISPEDYIRETQLNHPAQVERAAKIIENFPTEAMSVLDVGCGGGIALHRLLGARPELQAVGLERSAPTAQAARNLFGLEIVEGRRMRFHLKTGNSMSSWQRFLSIFRGGIENH